MHTPALYEHPHFWKLTVNRTLMCCLLIAAAGSASAQLELTLFHANDGESALPGYGEEGGVHRFVSVLQRERDALGNGHSLTISSGDNYLAGRYLAASIAQMESDLTEGVFYDALFTRAVGYDAVVIGNHEFDFGPGLLGRFIEQTNADNGDTAFLTANLDFSASKQISDRAKQFIAPARVFEFDGVKVGLVAATTPMLANISSPGDVVVNTDVQGILQQQIDDLSAQSVNIIILASHLQSVAEDAALIRQLRGVDFAIAGGGDELLANPDTLLVPSHADEVIAGSYPLVEYGFDDNGAPSPIVNADGVPVPVVTTSGQFRYLGRITLHFDAQGNLEGYSNPGPVRVIDASGGHADGVQPNEAVLQTVVRPVEEFSSELDATRIGTLDQNITLDARRTEVRTRETGFGNLIADALRAQIMHDFAPSDPLIGLQNGGGIRNDVVLEPGSTMTMGHTFDALPFPNFVSLVSGVSVRTLKETLENAVSRVERGDGRFLQISGMRMEYDPNAQPRWVNRDGSLRHAGSRVRKVTLENGTVIIHDGNVVSDITIAVATNDFTAQGGDYHNLGELTADRYHRSTTTYQQAVANYIKSMNGAIQGNAYKQHGEGRIVRIGE